METELCSIGWPCTNIALHLPDFEYKKYFENPKPNKGAAAFWEDGLAPDGGDPPPDPGGGDVWIYGAWEIHFTFDGAPSVSFGATEGSVKAPLSFSVVPADNDQGMKVVVTDGSGSSWTDWGPRSNSFPDATPIMDVSVANVRMWLADTGDPYDPSGGGGGDGGDPPETFILVKTIHSDGSMSVIASEPFDEKPETAWISCEECLEHCVPMVRNPGDTYEQSVCICKEDSKDPEPDEEAMKARIKAELLVEVPPIVLARFKATEEEGFISKVAQDAHKLVKPELRSIVESILSEPDEEGVSFLESIVLGALDKEAESLPNLYASLKSKLIADTELLNGLKESLNKDKYTFTSLIAQLDDKNITELRTKLKIPLNPDDPNNTSNNDLLVNGTKWLVVKSGNVVDKVQKKIETNDNISALLGSGDAIAAALQLKYSKPFSIVSAMQADGNIIFDVSEN